MASHPPQRRERADRSQPDRLSNLPDPLLITILSFLPTRIAARTSILSRRFRHLWKASPVVDLGRSADSARGTNFQTSTFVAMANCALRTRLPSDPPLMSLLLNLSIDYTWNLPDSFFISLLVKAHSLGLRHLTLTTDYIEVLDPIIPTIFFIDSLHSLQLPTIDSGHLRSIPSVATLTRLKSLSLSLFEDSSAKFNRLLPQLPSLEYLSLCLDPLSSFSRSPQVYTLSSRTIRKLDLDIALPKPEFVGLYIPSLEMLHLEITNPQSLPRIEGDVPSLRKAIIVLHGLHEGDVGAVSQLLNCVSSAEELSLDIKESSEEKYPFPILSELGKGVPNFPNLKHLDVDMCFHEHNFESIIAWIRHFPALESVKLVHEAPDPNTLRRNHRKRKDWRSKLPPNAADFILQILEEKEEKE